MSFLALPISHGDFPRLERRSFGLGGITILLRLEIKPLVGITMLLRLFVGETACMVQAGLVSGFLSATLDLLIDDFVSSLYLDSTAYLTTFGGSDFCSSIFGITDARSSSITISVCVCASFYSVLLDSVVV